MRIFISHSSNDKESYCNAIVDFLIHQVGESSIVYDALTFEAGEKSIDEINRTLDITDLFVILLSPSAVESDWVKRELKEAHNKLSDRSLNRIYPLIIDSKLEYSDDRIPEWLKEYNLKYIARPRKAAKLIIERAKDVNWSRHPDFQNRKTIFVGRNELINEFETRIDNFEEPPLNSFIVSGLPNIGRKSLARQCFIKGTIIPQYYEFPTISLSYQESIEDFIIKLNDLGFTDDKAILNLASKSMDEKIECATFLSKEISKISEIVLIKDDGCIVDYRGNLSEWFKRIISSESLVGKMIFLIITRYKMNFESIRFVPSASYINVPELSRQERNGLLMRLASTSGLSLGRAELEAVSKHLTGYPAQVHYAIEIIKNHGYPYLSRNFKLLSDYNEQEVSSLLEKHKDDEKVLHLLALVARYDAISVTMLYEILNTTEGYVDCYENLYQHSLFELEGVNKEYVRLNEVVCNYIARSGIKVLPEHQKCAQQIFEEMFCDESGTWYNSNDFLLAIRESITQGKRIEPKYVIPSVYLKSMSDLYSNMQYDNVVKLAKLALENSENTDDKILYEIRYQLCSALAKLRSPDFLSEVQRLEDDDKTFLTAFYYRQIGKHNQALSRLNQLLAKRPEMSKAKREKVLVLKNLQEFEEAMGLAKENYYLYSDNPYHIQAYFDCLINTYYDKPEDELLYDLLGKLGRIRSEKAQSMYSRCNALYLAYVENNYEAAIKEINRAIDEFPRDKKYALTVKFDIARLFHKTEEMESVIKSLELDGTINNTIVICKSRLLADQGEIDKAIDYFLKNISFFTDDSKKAFCDKLKTHI
ncbi:MAG: TIR domain-containing protein [Clostridiales bacterium]|nr:TIR domain-containing protein [Candidatus Equinaster intestinalis]